MPRPVDGQCLREKRCKGPKDLPGALWELAYAIANERMARRASSRAGLFLVADKSKRRRM